MSCPVIHGNNSNKKQDDSTIVTMQSIKTMQDSLLIQPCFELRKKFDACRVDVAKEKELHCAEIAENFLTCERKRMQKQKAYFGGKSNWSLFELYHDCLKNEKNNEIDCLTKIKQVTDSLL